MITRTIPFLMILGLSAGLSGGLGVHAQVTATLRAHGLAKPVEIIRDRWGINHIYAQSENDLFFAQGYAAARDRLFQFEMWRRQATGTVAEILGRRELKRDLGARLHMFRGDIDAELNHYHPRGKAIIEAFVGGINAYIAETERNPSLLPIEFTMLGIKPGQWTPAVVISRHQALTSNVTAEVNYMRAMKRAGPDAVRELMYFQGGEPVFTPDPSIDLSAFPDNVLEVYSAFRGSINFEAGDVAPEYRLQASAPRPQADLRAMGSQPRASWLQASDPTARDSDEIDPRDIGSNNWVVAGSRTQSTYPIMANDPHRTIAAPSLRYWVHLVAPGWNVIGGGEPVLPGVSIGHNGHGAWGLTIFGNDNEDLYVYETNPANPDEYRYQGRWEAMRTAIDTIAVKGEKPERVTLKYTRHGPVIFEDHAARRAYAVRAAWLEPGGAPYLASLRMNQARTWEEFRDACSYNRMPAENMVWADRTGTIGWQAAGIQPLRKNWSGLLPVPGDGRYEWDGYLPINALPHEVNPSRGFLATANHYLFPNDYPWRDALHYTWADPYRASRITEILGSGRLFSVAETASVQNDNLSLPARALVPLLRDLSLPSGPAAQARSVLTTWNSVMDKDSVAAGVYAMWQRRLLSNTRERLLPPALRGTNNSLITLKRVIDALHAPDGRFGEHPTRARDALIAASLDEAVAELTRRFGPDMQNWKYGQDGFHHALIRHPLSGVVNAETRARLSVGPLPRGGDGSTISATGNGDNQTGGGSFKIIVDTENWDNSIGINTPGQAGNPDDPHYRDLFELWARGKYFTLAYSRAKVESVRGSTLRLEPASATNQR
ncbi:MAG TPA: penicillin acylase family protein [Vicinamibacterales bacterium]|nr:penicillin acylase family protein [Vicinamibacterales bacterium]